MNRSSVHPMHPSNGLEIFSLSPFLWKAFRWMHLLGSSGETLTQSCRRRDIKTNSLVHIDLTTFDCSMLSLSLSPFLTLSFNLCLALQIRTHLLSQAVLGRHTLSRSRRYRRRWRRRRQRRWRHERFYRFSKRFSVDCSRIVASEREKSSLIILISVFEHKKFFQFQRFLLREQKKWSEENFVELWKSFFLRLRWVLTVHRIFPLLPHFRFFDVFSQKKRNLMKLMTSHVELPNGVGSSEHDKWLC